MFTTGKACDEVVGREIVRVWVCVCVVVVVVVVVVVARRIGAGEEKRRKKRRREKRNPRTRLMRQHSAWSAIQNIAPGDLNGVSVPPPPAPSPCAVANDDRKLAVRRPPP